MTSIAGYTPSCGEMLTIRGSDKAYPFPYQRPFKRQGDFLITPDNSKRFFYLDDQSRGVRHAEYRDAFYLNRSEDIYESFQAAVKANQRLYYVLGIEADKPFPNIRGRAQVLGFVKRDSQSHYIYAYVKIFNQTREPLGDPSLWFDQPHIYDVIPIHYLSNRWDTFSSPRR